MKYQLRNHRITTNLLLSFCIIFFGVKIKAQTNPVGPLIQTQWHQGSPYNDMAPVWNFVPPYNFSQKSPAGCGAIAVAQLLRYYKTNNFISGQASYISYLEYKLAPLVNPPFQDFFVDFDMLDIDYSKMAYCNYKDSNIEVSELIYITGVAIKQKWGFEGTENGGTSSVSSDIDNALVKIFDFKYKSAVETPLEPEETTLMKAFLYQGKPMLGYLYSEKQGGHYVIIDGYNSEDEFHINWGMKQNLNNYYDLSNIGVSDFVFKFAACYIPNGDKLLTKTYPPDCTPNPNPNLQNPKNTKSRSTSISCPTIQYPAQGETISNNRIQFLWDDVPDAASYIIRVTSLTTGVTWYDDVESYAGNPFFETEENLPPGEFFLFTLRVVDEYGEVTTCASLNFFTNSESCNLNLEILDIYCSQNGQDYIAEIKINGIQGKTYDLFSQEQSNVIFSLNSVSQDTHQIVITSGMDVAIVVEDESNPSFCNDAVSIIGPSCQNFKSLDLTWPSTSGTCFEKGTSHTVNWNTQGSVSSVNIELCNTLSFLCQDLEANFNNLGFYYFNIPINIDDGYYSINISSNSNPSVQDYSNIFEINTDCNAVCDPVTLSLDEPNHKEAFSSGELVHFSWIHNGPTSGSCAPQQYHLQLDDNIDFISPQNEYNTSNSMDLNVSGIPENFWRVRTHYNNGDYGPWSAIRKVIIYDSNNLPLKLASCINYENPICSGENNQVTVSIKNETPLDWNGLLRVAFLDANGGQASYKELSNRTILAGQTKTFWFNIDVTLPPNNNIVLAVFEKDASTTKLAFLQNGVCPNIIDVEIDNCFSDLDFTWYPQIIVEDQPIDFDDVYNGGIVQSNWYFEGGLPNSITDNSNASDILFPNPGYYDVELEVQDVNGIWHDITKTLQVYSEDEFLPDLFVADVASSPGAAKSGQNVDLTWTIQNDGISSIKFQRINYYFSDDNVLSSSDYQYPYDPASDYYSTTLANGGSISDSRTLAIPHGLGVGIKYIIIKAEDYNHSSLPQDVDTLNNILALPINIVPTLPDLALQNVSISNNNVESGEEFDATVTFINIGDAAVPGNPCVNYNIYLSEDDSLSLDDFNYEKGNYIDNGSWCRLSQYFETPNGASPDVHTRTISTLPHTPSGDYFLLFCFDTDIQYNSQNNEVDESDEINNIVAIPLTVSNQDQPTIQASGLNITDLGENSISLSWQNGNGNERLVMAYNKSFQYRKPIDDTSYVANTDWTIADRWVSSSGSTDNNTRIVYQGTDNSTVISNLDSNQTYFFSVFELNQPTGMPDYLQADSELEYTTTRDTSDQWQKIYVYPNSYFKSLARDIEFLSQDTAIVVGTKAIMTSVDAGSSFSFKKISSIGNSEIEFESVSKAGNKVIAVGHNDLLVTSSDNGLTWNTVDYDPSVDLDRGYSVHFVDDQNGFIAARRSVDQNHLIYGTTDGGNTWNIKFNTDTVRIYDIKSVGNSIWIVGQYGKIFKSNNLGENWYEIPNNLPSEAIYSIEYASPTITYCTVNSVNGIYKSIDGGYNWDLIHTAGFVGSAAKLKFFDKNKGYYVTNDHLLKTLDGGISWDSISLSPYSSITNYQCLDLNESGDILMGGFDILKYDNMLDICTMDVFKKEGTGYGSLTFALSCAESGDTIHLMPQLAFDTIWVENDLLYFDHNLSIEGNVLDNIVIGSMTQNPIVDIDPAASVSLSKFTLFSGNNQNLEILHNRGSLSMKDMILNLKTGGVTWTCGDLLLDESESYSTVQIGQQCWMAENLDVGTMINGSTSQADNSVVEKYCYDNDPANCSIYGGLYQWNEMMNYTTTESTQGVCPDGWHLPSDNEYKTLEIELGMTQAEADMTGGRGTDQGSQLSTNEPLWTDGLLDQNVSFGSSGFDGLPGGGRSTSGSFSTKSIYSFYWSSTDSSNDAWRYDMRYTGPLVQRSTRDKEFGFSVRCVRD